MKKLIMMMTLMMSLVLFNSCQKTPEQKAQDSITTYLLENLNDAKSYESVKFGSLINDSTTFDDPEFEYEYESDSICADISSDAMNDYLQIKIKYDSACIQHNIKENKFKPKFTGYLMTHTYRAKNKLGGTILETTMFVLDDKFNIIRSF